MTFSTLVTPTRDSETWTVGAEAWTSAPAGIVMGSILPFRVEDAVPRYRADLVLSLTTWASAACHRGRPPGRERMGSGVRGSRLVPEAAVVEGSWGREYQDRRTSR